MAGGPESIQAILRGRRRAGFVGRGGQLAVFRENFGRPPAERAYIFNVYGEGGVGKSTLLEQWRQIARAAGAAEALVDERVFSAPEAMSALLDQLAQPREAKEFRARYASFRKNRERLERDPQAPPELWSKIVRTGVKAGLHASKAIPGAAPVVELVDGDTAADAVDRVRQFLTAKVRDSREVHLMLYPTEELGPLFAQSLARIAGARPVVLFFDTFEQSGIVLEDWLADLMSGAHGELPASISLVIAGRLPLDTNRWAELFDLIAPAPLAVFTDVETRQLLAAHDVTDSGTVEAIMSLSGGLPLLVDMLAKSRPAGAGEIDDPADTAVERFLKWEPDEIRRQAALAGALPRRVDEDLLRAALDRDDVAALFTWLAHQAFVRGDRYHDVVRAPMLRHQRQRSPQRWREAHARLAAAHRERRDLTGATPWATEDWQTHHFEAVYHGLCGHELALDAALGDATQAVDAGIAVARRWAEVIMEAGRDGDDAETFDAGRHLFEAATRGENEAAELLTYLIDSGPNDDAGRARLLLERARLRYYADLDEMAIEDCTQALRHDPELTGSYSIRAAAKSYLGRHDEALADFERVLRVNPRDFWALSRRGQTYWVMGRFDEALADLDRAIDIEPASAWTISQRAETYRLTKRYDKALADFDRAVDLDMEGDAWTIGGRGQTLIEVRRYDEALADFNRAIELDADLAWLFAYRGVCHRLSGRLDESLTDLNQALEMSPDSYGYALGQRGATYRELKRYAEALADLDRVIELDAENGWAFAGRAEVYRLLQRHRDALLDFERAVTLGEADSWTIGSRGQTHAALGDFTAALADLDRAIELDEANDWAVAERADVHRRLGRYDRALADIERSIELDDSDGSAFVLRGVVREALGQADAAEADFRRARELDPGLSWRLVDGVIVFDE